jgi:hypothetical protein
MDTSGFISWQQFVKQPHISRLSLNEQTYHYQLYIHQFNMMVVQAMRGSGESRPFIEIGDLLQEDSFSLLQEDNSTLRITIKT